jgi:DNA-binding transcriptional LysR family regulator
LHLDVTNREALVHLLEENQADIVLMGQPPKNLDLEAEPFMDNPLVAIAPPEHPLAREKRISLQRLAEEVFVMREPGSGTRQAMERFFIDKGLNLRQGMEMTRAEAIKQAVRAGLGLGIVSIHTVELEMETRRLVLLDVVDFPIERQWFLVYRRGKRLSPVADAFRSFVLTQSDAF